MADLTSTIRVSGTINGRVINVTHSVIVENVDDVAHLTSVASRNRQPDFVGNEYDYPCYMASICRSRSAEFNPSFVDTTASVTVGANLHPNEFMVLCPDTGLGMLNKSSTATTATYLDVDTVQFRSSNPHNRSTEGVVFMAFKPVT